MDRFPCSTCVYTTYVFAHRSFVPWMDVPGRQQSLLRQGSWRQYPPSILSLPRLSLSTHSHLAGSSYSPHRYIQCTVLRVTVCGCLCAQLQNPLSLVSHFSWQPIDSICRDTSRQSPFSHTGQLSHYEAETSGPAPVTAGGYQRRRRRRRRRGCGGILQTAQGVPSYTHLAL